MNQNKNKLKVLSESDDDLIKSFQGGNKHAFDRLVLRHKDKIYGLCYWFLQDYDDASDCAQESFIKAYNSLNSFRFESAFSTWLYRITVNTCKNRFRSKHYRHRKKSVPIENPGRSEDGSFSLELKDGARSPHEHLEKKERQRHITAAIESLPAKQRLIVILRDIQGFSYEEISAIAGLSLGTVKSRLSRARMDLREKLRSVI